MTIRASVRNLSNSYKYSFLWLLEIWQLSEKSSVCRLRPVFLSNAKCKLQTIDGKHRATISSGSTEDVVELRYCFPFCSTKRHSSKYLQKNLGLEGTKELLAARFYFSQSFVFWGTLTSTEQERFSSGCFLCSILMANNLFWLVPSAFQGSTFRRLRAVLSTLLSTLTFSSKKTLAGIIKSFFMTMPEVLTARISNFFLAPFPLPGEQEKKKKKKICNF